MKRNILLFGSSSKLSLNILYCLSNTEFVVHFLSNNTKNAARFSKLTASYQIAKSEVWELDEIISFIKLKQIDLIVPVGESEVIFIDQYKSELENHCHCHWVTPTQQFKLAVNKHTLAEELKAIGVPVPIQTRISTEHDLLEFINVSGFPVIIKPTSSSFGWGVRKFSSLDALITHYRKNNLFQKDYVIQQFIEGSDIDCNIFAEHGKILCHTIQESPVRSGLNFNPHDTIAFAPDENVLEEVTKVIAKFQWHGIANFDIRRDIKTNKIYILEINGRYWGSLIGSLKRAGVNFPKIAAHYALGERIAIPDMHRGLQISLAKFLKSLVSLKPASIKDTKFHSYSADPKARMMQMLEKFR